MTERCDLTELLPEQCGCRKHRNSPDPTATGDDLTVVAWFAAAYPGRCVACDEPIAEGDQIGRTSGGYVCDRHR